MFTLRDADAVQALLPAIKPLQQAGILQDGALALWNRTKLLSGLFRRETLLDRQGQPNEFGALQPLLGNAGFIGIAALYALDGALGANYLHRLRQALHGVALQVLAINHQTMDSGNHDFGAFRPLVPALRAALWDRPLHLGEPMALSLNGVYYPLPVDAADSGNPDADGCGLHWLCHVVPNSAAELTGAIDTLQAGLDAGGFETNLSLVSQSPRHWLMFAALVYDRAVPDADARAFEALHATQAALQQAGYSCYRAGPAQALPPADTSASTRVLQDIKRLLDPAGVLHASHCPRPALEREEEPAADESTPSARS